MLDPELPDMSIGGDFADSQPRSAEASDDPKTWTCSLCKNVNYEHLTHCASCSAVKGSPSQPGSNEEPELRKRLVAYKLKGDGGMREPKRIPYHTWANSQLSVARHYGGCIFNGVQYKLDYDNCPAEGEDDNIRYFPDLVEVTSTTKRRPKLAKAADALPNNVNEETK